MKILFSLSLSIIMFLASGYVDKIPYEGGSKAFYKHFSELSFPDGSNLGVAILYWQVNNGEVHNARILNSLGRVADQEILRVLELTKGHWLSDNSSHEFRLPISFSSGSKDFFVDPIPSNYLDVVLISKSGSSSSFPSDEKLIAKLDKNTAREDYAKAEEQLNELLRRNPFNAKIRDIRVLCYNKLRKFDLACQDIMFMENELNMKSMFSCVNQ